MTEQELMDFPGAQALRAAGRVEPAPAAALARALAVVEGAVREEQAALASAAGGSEGAVVVPLFRRRRVLALVAAAAVAAGALAGAGIAAGPSGGGHGTRAGSASAFLDGVAEVAAARPAGSGRFWKMQTRTGTAYVSRSMELTYVTGGKVARKSSHFPGWQLGTEQLDWNGLDKLTTDPAALRRLLLGTKQGHWEEDAGTVAFEDATTMLANSPADAQLRAGLFKALAGLKGVTEAGTAKDAAGRSGTELAYRGDVGTTSVIVDPRTSTLLQLDTPWKSERDDRQVTVMSAGLTDTIGETETFG